jgi:hypothetical protein
VASAAELAGCYRERWESETCYESVKTHQRGPRAVLRFTDPDGVRQEIYAYLITYQAIRHLITQAATAEGIDPDRLSFGAAARVGAAVAVVADLDREQVVVLARGHTCAGCAAVLGDVGERLGRHEGGRVFDLAWQSVGQASVDGHRDGGLVGELSECGG